MRIISIYRPLSYPLSSLRKHSNNNFSFLEDYETIFFWYKNMIIYKKYIFLQLVNILRKVLLLMQLRYNLSQAKSHVTTSDKNKKKICHQDNLKNSSKPLAWIRLIILLAKLLYNCLWLSVRSFSNDMEKCDMSAANKFRQQKFCDMIFWELSLSWQRPLSGDSSYF